MDHWHGKPDPEYEILESSLVDNHADELHR
jgi:hypothetical protein